ncbi:MAG: FAD-dependent oxidoreductase [Limnochordia bacterium]|jgi:NADPH-dependent 2,4-dienoyl-CoA reductase/sulfur reductase-like enzyme/rhodanese-related sulfurtransferase|nr:FAD-dependent oxidoreductase [Bacillota bacterium]
MAKVVIVGGVAGGATAAARMRRLDEDAEIVLLERGEYVSFANCGLPYHIGGVIPDRESLLVQTAAGMRTRYRIDVRTGHEVLRIHRPEKEVEVLERETGKVYREGYDYLVLSPGAEPIRPDLPGIDAEGIFILRTMEHMDSIIDFMKTNEPRRAVVVGAGFIGLEMAENLHALGLQVDIVEMAPQVFIQLDEEMAALVHARLRKAGVGLHLGRAVKGFREREGGLEVQLVDGSALQTDMVILAVGVRPDTRLAEECGLLVGGAGILVNDYLQTSDPSIYALGDAIEIRDPILNRSVPIPLAGPANKQGRIVANNISGRRERYSGSVGTAIVQVFGLHVGVAGANRRSLEEANIDFSSVVIHPLSHAGYYPGAKPLSIKVHFTRGGRILGAQVVGEQGVDKRIDVLATAIKVGLTVYDLQGLELAYAPPFSSAKDPVNMVGFVAGNVCNGDVYVVNWDEIGERFVLDVREPSEYAKGHIPGAVNIPLGQLRERLGELPRDREMVVYCRVGMRSYIATRILMQRGFKSVFNLSGGYRTYRAVMADK